MSTSAAYVLSKYRELLRLIQRLPSAEVPKSLSQARSTIRERRHEQDPTKVLEYQKELAARISFLRITAPRQPGTPLEGGKYVFRNGEWVQGGGESKGSRLGADVLTVDEAIRRNERDYKRFYGKPKARDMFF